MEGQAAGRHAGPPPADRRALDNDSASISAPASKAARRLSPPWAQQTLPTHRTQHSPGSEAWGPCRDRLRADTRDHPLLIAEPSHQPPSLRERTVEAIFEHHAPPALYLARNAMLSSFACGRQTSLVVDAGHAATVGAFSSQCCAWPCSTDNVTIMWEHVLPSTIFSDQAMSSFYE